MRPFALFLACLLAVLQGILTNAAAASLPLKEGWQLQSSTLVKEPGEVISTEQYHPEDWHPTSVPSTALKALVKNGVYPDPRIGLNDLRIPDSSDEFNARHDLKKYSHLPDKRNPWRDPYWYRTTFILPEAAAGKHVWLNFKGINYRADVWLNGRKLADRESMVGMYQRFRLEATSAKVGKNYLAVKVYPVDHPGVPTTQLAPLGPERNFVYNQICRDVTMTMAVGYDCMPTIRDRNLGIWEEVEVDWTGPVDLRHPFVVTDLPLPKTAPAFLTFSAELTNVTASRQTGVLKATVVEEDLAVQKAIELAPGETKQVKFTPEEFSQLVFAKPRLWWPKNYGPQNLYTLSLAMEVGKEISAEKKVTFGIRKITKELHQRIFISKNGKLETLGSFGLRLVVNGQKIPLYGGWIQPEILFDWDAKRMDAEVRHFTDANFTSVSFEGIPAPPEAFLEACDRRGLLVWNSYYASSSVSPMNPESLWGPPPELFPRDIELLDRCTIDVIKRTRNHPSLILHNCCGEGLPREDLYAKWRKNVIELDGTRLFIPTANVFFMPEWIRQDMPIGVSDVSTLAHREFQSVADYYRAVRDGGEWMFSTETPFSPAMPIYDSLRRFIPDLGKAAPGAPYPLNATWAHHGANHYFKAFDQAIRSKCGEPTSVEDYCMKGHLLSAEHHRGVSEAVNHRLWEITSGSWEWKVNSCWPDVQWQIYDWYLRPTVSLYYYRKAFEPLHVQWSPLDGMVTVINNRLEPQGDLDVRARLYDFDMKLLGRKQAKTSVDANTYKDVFAVADIPGGAPFYFVSLELRDAAGQLVSDNFYWVSAEKTPNYTHLADLPPVKLNVRHTIEDRGQETVACVTVENPSDRLAFFVHVALTRGPGGEEVLPTFWDDNYFSLLPEQSKQLRGSFAKADLQGAVAAIDVGGWNIESDYRCLALKPSQTTVKAGETFTVTATVADTCLDGSRVTLLADGQPAGVKRAWARGKQTGQVSFEMHFANAGQHEIAAGDQRVKIQVK